MSTTTAEPTFILDERPLHVRLKDKLNENDNKNKLAASAAGVTGAVSGAAIGYLGYVVSMAFLTSIGVPPWVMQLSQISGYISVAAYTIWGYFIAHGIVRDR